MDFEKKRRIELRLQFSQSLRLEIPLSIRIDLNVIAQRFNEVDFFRRNCTQGFAIANEQLGELPHFAVVENGILGFHRSIVARVTPSRAVGREFGWVRVWQVHAFMMQV